MTNQHVYLKHACHICKKLYLNAANLRRHYIDIGDLKLSEVAFRFYNTTKVSFISKDHFNRDNLKELRKRLADTQDWEKEYDMNKHHDLDWTKHTIYSYIIRLYESGELNTTQEEQWYNKHVWHPIDTAFDDVNSVHIVVGESVSLASASRKNKSRTIGSTPAIKRVRLGYKCDMVVRERKATVAARYNGAPNH